MPIIISADEDTFLLGLTKNQTTVTPRGAWIGLIRKAADFKFYWIDDTPLERQYKAWAQGEPKNDGGNENCANYYANTNAGKWNDLPCELGADHQKNAPVVLCLK